MTDDEENSAIALLRPLCNSVEEARTYLYSAVIPEFGGRTLAEVVERDGIGSVAEYVMHIERGGFA